MGLVRTLGIAAAPLVLATTLSVGSALAQDTEIEDVGSPLTASAGTGVADGRSVVEITATGGPPPQDGELAQLPEQPLVQCGQGQRVAGGGPRVSAILVPAAKRDVVVPCTVSLRGQSTDLSLSLTKPRPGVYLGVPAKVVSRTGPVILRPFVVGSTGMVETPTRLRVHASDGSIRMLGDGSLELDIGDSKAPRTISIAMSDGTYGGVAYVVVSGASILPVKAQRGSKVRVRTTGVWSKEVRTRRGRAKVPIEVLPGVARAVVRATLRGYPVESAVSLPVAPSGRVSAVAVKDEVAAGGETAIIVGYGGRDGRPGGEDTQFSAQAARGSVEAAVSLGPGLWRIRYKAPSDGGDDSVTVGVEGDDSAGNVTVNLAVGAVHRAKVAAPVTDDLHEPGMTVGAWVGGGAATNVSGLTGPRLAAGVGVERDFGLVEGAVLVGVEWFGSSSGLQSDVAGAPRTIDRTVRTIGVPVTVRGRYGIAPRWGAWASVAVAPTSATVELMPDFQTEDRYTDFTIGFRGAIGGDVAVWRGRLNLGLSFGHTAMSGALAEGTLERLSVLLGYELWFFETGY